METYIRVKSTKLEKDRIEMSKLAVEDSEWINVSTWEVESSKTDFTGYPEVVNELFSFLSSNEEVKKNLPKGSGLVVAYVCGEDFILRTGAEKLKLDDQHWLAVIKRSTGDKKKVL